MASDEMSAPSKTCVGAEESHGRSVGGGYDHPCRAPQLLLLHGKEDRTPPICRDGVEEDEGGLWTSHPRKRERRESSPPGAEEGQVFRTEEKTAMAGEAVAGSLIRLVCSRCGTSRTPMWRSGPAGPKTLCNACGIRYRKMRRSGGVSSFAAAASAGDDPQKQEAAAADEEEARKQGEKLQRRQRRRREVLWMLLRESKRFSFRCGEEEAEAAVLLMAISSGLFVHTSH